MIFYGNKMDVVRFATALQLLSPDAWLSTTITRVGRSGVYSVSTAIDGLSAGTAVKLARDYSLQDTNTSHPTIRDISSRRKK